MNSGNNSTDPSQSSMMIRQQLIGLLFCRNMVYFTQKLGRQLESTQEDAELMYGLLATQLKSIGEPDLSDEEYQWLEQSRALVHKIVDIARTK